VAGANATTYTTFADGFTLSAAIANEHILGALYDLNHVNLLTRMVDLRGIPSKSHDIGLWPRLTAAAVSEGVDLQATQVVSTKATVTAAEQGIMIIPTDALNLSSLVAIQDFAIEAASAVREKQMADVSGVASSFTNTTTNTGTNVTEVNIFDAEAALANRRQMGNIRGLMYTQQWFDYVASVGSTFTPASSTGGTARGEMRDFRLMPDGFQRDVLGVEWYASTSVITANSGADSNAMLVNPSRAIARGVKYESRVEIQRDASLRATEIVVTAFDGVAVIEDEAGQGLITDR
jgi:hypothetical protein